MVTDSGNKEGDGIIEPHATVFQLLDVFLSFADQHVCQDVSMKAYTRA
jgi:hypothetical protein